jgi:outer membrane receptor protein involved in Fe transport
LIRDDASNNTVPRACLVLLGALAGPAAVAQPVPQQTIEIVGTSPLRGQSVPRDALPYTTQRLRRDEIDAAQAETLTDLLARRVPGVQVNQVQGSPFQGDLSYRGQRASGLLGAAQGLSVYLDGVRINEAFGDIVSWDLVPEWALDDVALVSGANPAFGLNTLGGAIVLHTADGRRAPGLRGEASIGSFGRWQGSLSHGGEHEGGWHHYVGLGLFGEDGWRDFSDGRLGTVMAKVGRQDGADDVVASLLAGDSRLVGNGLVPYTTLDDDGAQTPDLGLLQRDAVYTHPDETRNRIVQASVAWSRDLGGGALFDALAYVRDARRETVNGDEAEEMEDDDEDEAEDDDEDGDEAGAPNASFNRTATRQRGWGLAAGVSGLSGAHRWQAGLTYDTARVTYEQSEQPGVFDETRGVQALDLPSQVSAQVEGRSSVIGAFASDTWQVASGTFVTAALRYNQASVDNRLSTRDDDTGVFEDKPPESFTYRSWNPALGIAQRVGAATLFASWARNHRVPTVIELGCADPEEPCRLPSGLQADPYLEQVTSTTVEGGMRWRLDERWSGSLALYRTDNRDDILFGSVSVTGQLGYFRNFPRTRYQGLDADLRSRLGAWDLFAAYSLLDATYEADGTLRIGERNVAVAPGTRIAGLPRHQLKLGADLALGGGWTIGADLQAWSSRGVAGNEDGRLEDDAEETVVLDVPGYAVVNLRMRWQPASLSGLEVFAGIDNVFDRRYASFGAIAETLFDPQGRYTGDEADALFVAPGAPRSFTAGMRWRF